MNRIAVIDYGMGNLRSVAKAIEHVAPNSTVTVTSDPEVVRRAERVVFPGQGAMRDCMREMDARGLRGAIVEAAREKPFLGICIGLQMLFEHSEEGNTPALALLPGRVCRFPAAQMVDREGHPIDRDLVLGHTHDEHGGHVHDHDHGDHEHEHDESEVDESQVDEGEDAE